MGRRLAVLLAGLLVLFTAFGVPLAAQDNPDASAPADAQLAGTVRTPDGTAVPGSTLRVIQTSTGKAWITWTDEDGKFEFPALPSGHYRVEISQLGFAPATREIDLASGTTNAGRSEIGRGHSRGDYCSYGRSGTRQRLPARPLRMKVRSPRRPARPRRAALHLLHRLRRRPRQITSAATPPGGRNGGGNGGQRGGGGRNGGGAGQGGGRRAFQQVGLNGQDQNPTENRG